LDRVRRDDHPLSRIGRPADPSLAKSEEEVMTMVSEWDRRSRLAAFGPRPASGGATSSMLSRLFGCIGFWRGTANRRLAVEPLDDHLLRDIGLTRSDINLLSRLPRRRT
jgi:uncharacterized protein YjiS (DUF1127 family)